MDRRSEKDSTTWLADKKRERELRGRWLDMHDQPVSYSAACLRQTIFSFLLETPFSNVWHTPTCRAGRFHHSMISRVFGRVQKANMESGKMKLLDTMVKPTQIQAKPSLLNMAHQPQTHFNPFYKWSNPPNQGKPT